MSTNPTSQIQLKIDTQTKEKAQAILQKIGLDINSAVKMMCQQIVRTGILPFEQRDENGFRPHKAKELRESIKDARNSKGYNSVDELMKELKS